MDIRVSSPIFIGRSDELERLQDALVEARGGRSAKVVIGGEAGVGKTRLVAEFTEAARRNGVLVLSGGCIDLGDGSVPYAPIVEALRTWVRAATGDELDTILGQGRSELARRVPDLGPIHEANPAGATGGLSIGSGQGRLFEFLLAVLQRLAVTSPVALVVEDLHWLDRSTRDLLAFLVRNIRDMGVLLIMTYRSDELHRRHPLLPFLAELERSGHVERLELGRFDRRELAAQLRGIAGPDVEQSLVDSIHARSQGNPFFAEELLVSSRDRGTAALPPTLREVLLAHVADLTEAAQELLRIASAAGQRVDPVLLAAATGLDGPEALRIAEEVDNLDDIGRAYGNRIDVLDVAGRLDEGLAVAYEGLVVARRLGLLGFFGTHFLCNAANLLYKLGRWEDSDAAARQAEEIGTLGINEILIRELVARLAMARGRFEEAGEGLRTVRPLAAQAADGQVILPVHASLGELALWQRRPAEADSVVAAGLAAIGHSTDMRHNELYALGIRAQADQAELARARRSAAEAATAISVGRELHEAVRQRHATARRHPALAPQSAAWMALCDAESHRLEGNPAPEIWRTAAEAWDALGRPYPAAYSRW